MAPFESLLQRIASSSSRSGPRATSPELDAVRERAAGHAGVTRLLSLVIDGGCSFSFGVLEIHPSVFTRLARHPHVLGPSELVVGHDGGGDLYVFDVKSGRVRRVIHDAGWQTRGEHPSLDAWIERIAWVSLESIEPEEVEELGERGAEYVEHLRWALEIQPDALQDETREALVAAGVLEG